MHGVSTGDVSGPAAAGHVQAVSRRDVPEDGGQCGLHPVRPGLLLGRACDGVPPVSRRHLRGRPRRRRRVLYAVPKRLLQRGPWTDHVSPVSPRHRDQLNGEQRLRAVRARGVPGHGGADRVFPVRGRDLHEPGGRAHLRAVPEAHVPAERGHHELHAVPQGSGAEQHGPVRVH